MKPILIGLHNPYSRDPADALAPSPDKSTGAALWKMLRTVDTSYLSPPSYKAMAYKREYRLAFDRINLLDTAAFANLAARRKEARERAIELLIHIPHGATVILLGREVFDAFNWALGDQLQLMLIHPQVADGVAWRWLPHPSGRSTVYNNSVTRKLAGLLLADVLNNQRETNATQ